MEHRVWEIRASHARAASDGRSPNEVPMLSASPARLLRRTLPVLPRALVLYGCADAPEPLAPPVPLKPNAVGPIVAVTNTYDAGPGSLRQAILDAAAGTTIQFDAAIAGQTIALTSAPLDVDKSLAIFAGGFLPGTVTSTLRVFQVK
jgi:hypothetical protein